MKKILLINLSICILVLLLFEICFWFKQAEIERTSVKNIPFVFIPKNLEVEGEFYDSGKEYLNGNNSIVLAGGSFAYSFGVDREESLASKLADYTKRPVFVRAICATGANEFLWLFKKDSTYFDIPEPEYMIYLFIQNHFSRLYSEIYSIQKWGGNKLRPMFDIDEEFNAKEKNCWYRFLFLSNIYRYFYYKNVTLNYDRVEEEQLYKTLSAVKKEVNKRWPNTKFVFLRYSEANIEEPFLFSEEFKEKLKENNIKYLDADEIVFGNTGQRMIGDDYKQPDDHPSALALDLTAKGLAENL